MDDTVQKPPRLAWVAINFPPCKWPQTTTVLAIGFLAGCLLFTPTIATVGRYILPEFRDIVSTIAGLFKDGMLLILGYYFAKRDFLPAVPIDPEKKDTE